MMYGVSAMIHLGLLATVVAIPAVTKSGHGGVDKWSSCLVELCYAFFSRKSKICSGPVPLNPGSQWADGDVMASQCWTIALVFIPI